jgi:hypothetical protein
MRASKSSRAVRVTWLLLALAAPVAAGPEEDRAAEDARAALETDLPAGKHAQAVAKLNKAIVRCAKKCAPAVVARLQRDLGVTYLLGKKDAKTAALAFKRAVKADPKVRLEARHATAEVRAAFEKAGGSAVAELSFEPPGHHKSGVPLPLAIEVPEAVAGDTLRVHVRRAGEQWQRELARKAPSGWVVEIGCDVVKSEGTLELWVEVQQRGAPVAVAASEDAPLSVELARDAALVTLPGEEPPKACAPAPAAAPSGSSGAARKLWLRLALHQDAAFVGGTDVCTRQSQDSDRFYCFRQDGVQYQGTPVLGQFDKIDSGLVVGTTRALAGADYVVADAISVGGSLGYAFLGAGPRPRGGSAFFPVHVEARGAYWLLGAPFDTQGFALDAFVLAGVAQVDAKKVVPVIEDPAGGSGEPAQQKLDAWKRLGRGFAGAGAGAWYGFGRAGALLELRALYLFPGSGLVLSPGIGAAIGL